MKKIIILNLLLVSVIFVGAQDHAQLRWWHPDQLKVQYAGGIGFLSPGAGYQNKKQNLEGDLFYGYVPKTVGGITIHMVTGKLTGQVFKPLTIQGFELRPLAVGLSLTYSFGPQYYLFAPDHYPYSYYGFPTALHGGLFAGGRISRGINSGSVGVYYEIGATDRGIISWAGNTSAIPVKEILHLAAGVHFSF